MKLKHIFWAWLIAFTLAVYVAVHERPPSQAGCNFLFFLIVFGFFILYCAPIVWAFRDAKSRGMDMAILSMLLMLSSGYLGLILYLFIRPQGNLVICSRCENKRLQAMARCPHCGNP